MSLVRPSDASSMSYIDSSAGSSTHMYTSNKRMFRYGSPSYYSSQSVASPDYQDSFLPPSSDAPVVGPLLRPQGSALYQLVSSSGSSTTSQTCLNSFIEMSRSPEFDVSNSVSELLDAGSPDDRVDYDEEDFRLKLEELERALLDDAIDGMFDPDQGMIIDSECGDPVMNLLLPDSPKESSSSDSNVSIISRNNKEMTQISPRTPKQLLFDCATAISEGNFEHASALVSELRQKVSIDGDPPNRIAAYMVEGLAARMAASGRGLYKALKCKEPPTLDRLSAMQILFEICPCFKFGVMAANGAIAEAVRDEDHVHIIDFDINQGSQYITLIQALSSRPGKPPHLRITGVDDPESVQRTVGGIKLIGQRLEKLAEAVGVPFEFQVVPAKTGDVTPAMLNCRAHEALVVNFAFQLHHMPDESVSTVNQRDQLLRMVKGLQPKLVTIVEQDINTNTTPFFPRFVEAYNYYSAVFQSLDATLPRQSPDRMNVERQCLARDIVNIVACEGEDRIERYEKAGKWRARMTMAGFVACPLSSYVNEAIRSLLKSYCDRFKVKEECGALHFGWEDKILIVTSAWK